MACAPSHLTPNLGRPREHDREKIAQELLEWAKKDSSINLNEFCCLHDPIIVPSKLSQWAKEDDAFRQAVESAKGFLGYRRERKLNANELHVKAYDLNATTYDFFLKEEKRQQAEFESALKQQEIAKVSDADAKKLDAFVKQVSDAQASSDARKIDANRIKADAKS